MFNLLERILDDFEEEIDILKNERVLPSIRTLVKKTYQDLTHIESLLWAGDVEEKDVRGEITTILTSAETEIGALLRTVKGKRMKSHQYDRVTGLLTRIGEYKEELHPSLSAPYKDSFRIPLFTRSNSFNFDDYEAPEEQPTLQSSKSMKCCSHPTEKKEPARKLETTLSSPELTRSRKTKPAPPPPPPCKDNRPSAKSKAEKPKSEIRRLPMVVKLFHSFRSRVMDSGHSKKQRHITKSQSTPADPSAVIGELMSKSKHAQIINQEAEVHFEKIRGWASQIREARFETMQAVVSFVQKMDKEISTTLTDEVTTLKRVGGWPKRYDILREAGATWTEMKELESTMRSWTVCRDRSVEHEIQRAQSHIEKTDAKIECTLRELQREEFIFKEAGVPWTPRLFEEVKAAALIPIEQCLQIANELVSTLQSAEKRKELLSKCSLLAFKGHQFVGGFNEPCTQAFVQIETAAQSFISGRCPESLCSATA